MENIDANVLKFLEMRILLCVIGVSCLLSFISAVTHKDTNQILTAVIGYINGVIAVFIVGMTMAWVYYPLEADGLGATIFSLLIGLVIGTFLAVIICGIIAILISINNYLQNISKEFILKKPARTGLADMITRRMERKV